MKNPFKKRIALELGIWFLILAVVPLALSTVVAHINTRQALFEELTSHLKDMIHEKVERVELYVRERKQSVNVLANTPSIVSALQQSCGFFSQHGIDPDSPVLSEEVRAFLRNNRQRFAYHDIFFINTAGDIVYTLAQEDDLGTNLRHGPYRETGLAWVFDKAITLLDSEISSFAYYAPSEKPAAFIAAPVFNNNKVVGAVAIQLNEDRLFSIFSDYIGLGESGELVAGARADDGSIIAVAPLRHDPYAYLSGKILTRGTELPIAQAAIGQKGAGLTVDYRGREILAAWDYMPELAWGLVVKIDREEVFAPIYRQDLIAASLLLVVLGLVIGGIFLATNIIADPVKKLTAVVKLFASGNFSARADTSIANEVGILAATFNDMAQDINEYKNSMENLVSQRTEQLEETRDSLKMAQQIAHIGSWEWDIVNNRLAWSDEIYRIFGLEPQQFAATYEAFLKAIHPDDHELVNVSVQEALENDMPYSIDHRVVRPDGTIRIVHELADISRDKNGKPLSMLGTVQDVTELRKTQRQLDQYIAIVDQNVITSATDTEGTITYASDAFCRISGYTKKELLGNNHRIVRHPDMEASLYEELWNKITAGKIWQGNIKNKAKDGHFYWVELTITPTFDDNGKIVGYTAIHNDITNKKKVEELSITDELTQLYNRRHFNEVFPQELNRARRNNKIFGFLMLDVDNFKKYNDTYGHQKGDGVLQALGRVFTENLKRAEDFSFRLGGEEFGAIFVVERREEADAVAEKLLAAIEGLKIPHKGNTAAPYVTASCGLVTITAEKEDDVDIDVIYHMADEALYRAKETGRNRYVDYSVMSPSG